MFVKPSYVKQSAVSFGLPIIYSNAYLEAFSCCAIFILDTFSWYPLGCYPSALIGDQFLLILGVNEHWSNKSYYLSVLLSLTTRFWCNLGLILL